MHSKKSVSDKISISNFYKIMALSDNSLVIPRNHLTSISHMRKYLNLRINNTVTVLREGKQVQGHFLENQEFSYDVKQSKGSIFGILSKIITHGLPLVTSRIQTWNEDSYPFLCALYQRLISYIIYCHPNLVCDGISDSHWMLTKTVEANLVVIETLTLENAKGIHSNFYEINTDITIDLSQKVRVGYSKTYIPKEVLDLIRSDPMYNTFKGFVYDYARDYLNQYYESRIVKLGKIIIHKILLV